MSTVETPYLYACAGCDKFYVLAGQQATCPNGHDVELVTPDSAYSGYGTCGNAACSHALGLTMTIDDGRCDHCRKRLGGDAGDLVGPNGNLVSKDLLALLYVPPKEEKGSHAARSLEEAVNQAEGFTTSHHKDKSGRHTATASATHARGDRENANVRKQKRKMILELIEKLENSQTYDPVEHAPLLRRANALAEKWK